MIAACFGDIGLVSGDLGLVLRYVNKSVYAFEIIIVVVCTYCSVSMAAVMITPIEDFKGVILAHLADNML